ncbi:hypothetical protein QZH41_011712, partial [Actinostola sp. cb2023]
SVEKAFLDNDGFDFCFNLAGETKFGQSKEVYEAGVYKLSINCAKEAAKQNIKRFIELSTAQVYSSDKKEKEENGKLQPWTEFAKYKLKVEQELANIENLNYIIIRPAITYGIGARQGISIRNLLYHHHRTATITILFMENDKFEFLFLILFKIAPRLIIGAVYKQLGEKMKLLWTKDLKMNTVHVLDVSQALWHLTSHGESGEIYNLCDKADSSQGSITSMVCEIFGIEHTYFGTVLSNLARLNMESTVEESNEKHLEPWSEACEKDGVHATPLSPYLDQELLYDKHLFVDGTKIEKTGFSYQYPKPSVEALRQVVQDYASQGLFPPSLFNPS